MTRPRRPNALLAIYVLGQLARSLLEEEFDGLALTANEHAVAGIVGFLGPITPSDLAASLGMPPSTLSAHIDRLVERGLVRRVPSERDRRSYLLEATPEGLEAVQAGAAAIGRGLARIDARLDVPRAEIEQALARLDAALRSTLDR